MLAPPVPPQTLGQIQEQNCASLQTKLLPRDAGEFHTTETPNLAKPRARSATRQTKNRSTIPCQTSSLISQTWPAAWPAPDPPPGPATLLPLPNWHSSCTTATGSFETPNGPRPAIHCGCAGCTTKNPNHHDWNHRTPPSTTQEKSTTTGGCHGCGCGCGNETTQWLRTENPMMRKTRLRASS